MSIPSAFIFVGFIIISIQIYRKRQKITAEIRRTSRRVSHAFEHMFFVYQVPKENQPQQQFQVQNEKERGGVDGDARIRQMENYRKVSQRFSRVIVGMGIDEE